MKRKGARVRAAIRGKNSRDRGGAAVHCFARFQKSFMRARLRFGAVPHNATQRRYCSVHIRHLPGRRRRRQDCKDGYSDHCNSLGPSCNASPRTRRPGPEPVRFQPHSEFHRPVANPKVSATVVWASQGLLECEQHRQAGSSCSISSPIAKPSSLISMLGPVCWNYTPVRFDRRLFWWLFDPAGGVPLSSKIVL